MAVLRLQILVKKLLPFPVNPLIQRPDIQHEVKDVVAGNDPAGRRKICRWARQPKVAAIRVILKKIRSVVGRVPGQPQLLRHHIQGRGLPRSVSPVQNCYRSKIQAFQMPLRQNPEGV